MAQPGLLVNHQNYESILSKDVGIIRMNDIDMGEAMSSNERTDNNSYIFLKDKMKSNKDNKTSSDSSNDRTDNESESESIANVLRWLQSLPLNFTKGDLNKSTNSYKLQETNQDLYRFDMMSIDDKRRESFEFSLKRKSTNEVPLEGKNNMQLENNDKKVEFFDSDEIQRGFKNARKKFCNRKIPTENTKASVKSFVSKLSKKSGQSDVTSTKTINRLSLISIKDNQKTLEMLKNLSENKLKNKQSVKQRQKIRNKIANNKRLLYILENIINVVDSSDPPDRMKNPHILKNYKRKKNVKRKIGISNNFNKFEESRTKKKPIFKNPVIEKKLDDAIKNNLKRNTNTWNCFKENDIINDEPPVKKKKRIIPTLAPANSLNPYVLI
ncbi:hypothetical protein M0802_000078 [Mischocyttarus mexicanus]|nr:hypothetical protein M0802_000078 [Mischocyttarus mexicanus]